jgi:hypothetical protein
MDHEGLVHLQPGGLRGLASAAVWTRGCAVGIQDYRQLLNRGSDSGISYQQFDVAMSRGPGDAEGETNRELGKLPRTAPYGAILQLGGNTHRPLLSVNDRCRPRLSPPAVDRDLAGQGRSGEAGRGGRPPLMIRCCGDNRRSDGGCRPQRRRRPCQVAGRAGGVAGPGCGPVRPGGATAACQGVRGRAAGRLAAQELLDDR